MFMMSFQQKLKQAIIDLHLKSLKVQPNEVVVEYESGPDKEWKYTYFMNYLTDKHDWEGDCGVRGQIFKDKGETITRMKERGFTIRELDHRFKDFPA